MRFFLRIPSPENYPTKKDFETKLLTVLGSQKEFGIIKNIPGKILPTEIIYFGKSDWKKVRGRGVEIEEYLYDLGKIMSSEFLYSTLIKVGDQIEIADNGEITNGRHRVLTLKILGEEYILSKNMNKYVEIQKI